MFPNKVKNMQSLLPIRIGLIYGVFALMLNSDGLAILRTYLIIQ